MNQLTRQDIADVVEVVLDRKLKERFKEFGEEMDQKLASQTNVFDEKLERQAKTFDEKLRQRTDELNEKLERQTAELDEKLEQRIRSLDEKLERQTGVLIEHFDSKCDGLAEAIQVINANTGNLARQDDLQAVKYDIRTIKVAVRATNDDLWR